jgi:hypothetical protein
MRVKLRRTPRDRRTPYLDVQAARPADHVVSARKADRTILLDMHRGRYYSVDGVGGRIWEMLGEGSGLAEMGERLAAEYDAPLDRILCDIESLLEQLHGRGLLA